ncbi:MAG: hypothetical protein R2822_07800 [Spirosomataceae bacterium]
MAKSWHPVALLLPNGKWPLPHLLDHPAHAVMVPQGFGAGVGKVEFEQGNWYRGGAPTDVVYLVALRYSKDAIRPQFPSSATQEQLIHVSRYFDLATEMPPVDWAKAFRHLPLLIFSKM